MIPVKTLPNTEAPTIATEALAFALHLLLKKQYSIVKFVCVAAAVARERYVRLTCPLAIEKLCLGYVPVTLIAPLSP